MQAEAVQLKEQELEVRAALAVLIGRPPQTFQVSSSGPDEIPLPAITPGLPSELLERRPDIAQAEAELASAHARLDAARASFFPKISLSGSDGYASSALKTLLRGPNLVWDVSATLLQTLFDGGKLRAQTAFARATQQELVSAYRQTVLNSYADVEVAMGQLRYSVETEAHLKSEAEAAREAFVIANSNTDREPRISFPSSKRSRRCSRRKINGRKPPLARMQAVVHLYQALGGGWQSDPVERTQHFKTASLTH